MNTEVETFWPSLFCEWKDFVPQPIHADAVPVSRKGAGTPPSRMSLALAWFVCTMYCQHCPNRCPIGYLMPASRGCSPYLQRGVIRTA